MLCRSVNPYTLSIIISVWTVVQTSFHILWASVGYFFYTCTIKPSHYWLIMLYLTYFYNNECGKVEVQNDGFFVSFDIDEPFINESSFHDIVKEIIEKAEFPQEAKHAQRTIYYLYVFLTADVFWIIAAFLLFVGTCCRVKKRLSLFFYVPWLSMTAIIIVMDVAAAVHFGVDLLQIKNYSTLLKFIGITNYKNFTHFDDYASASYVPAEFTSLICLLFARFLIVWIANIVNFSQIINIAILAYEGVSNRERRQELGVEENVSDSVLNLDSSESRIRTWQLFYGAIETTSTLSSEVSRKDCNSNEKPKKPAVRIDPVPYHVEYEPRISVVEVHQGPSTYRRFSDVSMPPVKYEKQRKGSVDSLRGQLPWSYTKSLKENFELNEVLPGVEPKKNPLEFDQIDEQS